MARAREAVQQQDDRRICGAGFAIEDLDRRAALVMVRNFGINDNLASMWVSTRVRQLAHLPSLAKDERHS
jgi:hypothetical protein